MTEKEIIKQLNNLQCIQPSADWKTGNREVLVNQINSAAQDDLSVDTEGFSIFSFPVKLFKTIPQPVLAVFLIVLFMLGSGFASIKASQDSKPGDSFYIAKIVSEKTTNAL